MGIHTIYQYSKQNRIRIETGILLNHLKKIEMNNIVTHNTYVMAYKQIYLLCGVTWNKLN